MSILKNIFTGYRGLKAATNVHLAELALPKLSAEEKRGTLQQMIKMWRSVGNAEIEGRIKSFNRYERLSQLNYLAIAMYYAGVQSPVPGEDWSYVSYPGVNLPDKSDLATNAAWFKTKRGVTVSVKADSLDITNWWNP